MGKRRDASGDEVGNEVQGAAERRDRIFTEPDAGASDFRFGTRTAAVFDDMVGRSVPYYEEFQRMTCELAADFAAPGTTLYDLGCATGTTLQALDQVVAADVRFVGVDNSEEMLAKARTKLTPLADGRVLKLVNADLNSGPVIEDGSVAILLLTLQFVRPLFRERVIRRICAGLRPNGCLILVEKILSRHSLLNRQFIKYYYELKRRRGYSEVEIAQKREALENVLVPYRHEENMEMLQRIGFTQVEEFFRWYNFCGVVAVK